ncbi:MAG: methyltransferase domain-containing protein [Chitinophagaceae bacterium]
MYFSQRSYKTELLDRDDIPFHDIRRNMAELNFINTHLGGHKITIDGVKRLIAGIAPPTEPLLICEIGCGGGDNLLAIHRWCTRKGLTSKFIGIDINPFCIEVASKRLAAIDVQLITSDFKLTAFKERKPDLIFSSLFCHHFGNDQLVNMLVWMKVNSVRGFFINDLHRHPLAYYSIKLLTQIFSHSYLVKNDAPLSVLRGFKKKEWKLLLTAAGINQFAVTWKWAFRFLITSNNQNHPVNVQGT